VCSEGVADADRAAELVEEAATGDPAALRILEDIIDPRALDVVAAAAGHTDWRLRRAALIALGGIGDERGIEAAVANLDDEEDFIRRVAIEALASMGPRAAAAIAARLDDPRDRVEAARALAWLNDPRAFEPLAMMLDSDTLIADSVFGGGTFTAMGRLGGPGAVDVLTRAADRVIAAADAGAVEWQVNSAASAIAQTLVNMRDPAALVAYGRLKAKFGWLYVVPIDPVEPYRAPPHPRRTVPRWSFVLEAVDQAIVEPVSKFGGQPVWIGEPTWPLSVDGAPTTFMAQFAVPGREGLAYLFLDDAAVETGEGWGKVIVRPGPVPVPFLIAATGPTFWTDMPGPERYLSRRIAREVESRVVLEPGLDFDDWAIVDDDPEAGRDDERDWNKIGGNPRWLQGDEMPEEPGWRFLFQFTAAKVGHEFADGAEVYGLIHDDGRGRFIVHSH
jgi:HEAT repeats/PBS lyase HEAT-like repeat